MTRASRRYRPSPRTWRSRASLRRTRWQSGWLHRPTEARVQRQRRSRPRRVEASRAAPSRAPCAAVVAAEEQLQQRAQWLTTREAAAAAQHDGSFAFCASSSRLHRHHCGGWCCLVRTAGAAGAYCASCPFPCHCVGTRNGAERPQENDRSRPIAPSGERSLQVGWSQWRASQSVRCA